jgi:Domain of unknown function (DUF222)
VQLEPLAFQQRHRRALAERRVTVVQGADGMGYVTGEVSAADAAPIDSMLAATARSLGAQDPRTELQRRSDLFANLLLGRLCLDESEQDKEQTDDADWLEIEDIDPDTGELLGTHLQRLNGAGEPIGERVDAAASRLKQASRQGLSSVLGSSGLGSWCPSPASSAPMMRRASSLIDPASYQARCCGSRSLKPSIPTVMMRCSPGSLPIMLAGCSMSLSSAATRQFGWRKPSGSAPEPVDTPRAAYRATLATLIITNLGPAARHPQPIWIPSAADTPEPKPSPGSLPSETTTGSSGQCLMPNAIGVSTSRCQQGEPHKVNSIAISLLLPDRSRYIVDVSIGDVTKAR